MSSPRRGLDYRAWGPLRFPGEGRLASARNPNSMPGTVKNHVHGARVTGRPRPGVPFGLYEV